MKIQASELILNPDGSIYHLNLLPEDVADTVITVGDPDRVAIVSSFFDTIELKKGKREFTTHTGTYKGKRITVISTGIGADNIDIVLNELDALVNIDFKTRTPKSILTSLTIIRIGTSGSIVKEIPVDSFVVSEAALGFDNTMLYYQTENDTSFLERFASQTGLIGLSPYFIQSDAALKSLFQAPDFVAGFTATFVGFYGPQGRKLRVQNAYPTMIDQLMKFNYQGMHLTNLEMETSAIYALASLFGHKAISLNCILANRVDGEFSTNAEESIKSLIKQTLSIIASNL